MMWPTGDEVTPDTVLHGVVLFSCGVMGNVGQVCYSKSVLSLLSSHSREATNVISQDRKYIECLQQSRV